MENANYGGHYVISSENLKGEYFVQVQHDGVSPKNEPVEYQIGYSLFDATAGELIPYKIFWIPELSIKYMYKENGTEFTLTGITRKDRMPVIGAVTYKLYISNNTDAINAMTKCSKGQVYTQKIVKVYNMKNIQEEDKDATFSISVCFIYNLVRRFKRNSW